MQLTKPIAALMAALILAGCGGGMEVGGGPSPDSMEGEMLAPNPSDSGSMDDATGTEIPPA